MTSPAEGHVVIDEMPVGASSLTDAQLRAAPVPVSGTFFQATQPVSGTFWQATQPVSGTFWQATQPVSGPLTDTQLRATPVPVSGTFYQATQPVSIASMPTTAVTGTFWQAIQPVSIASMPSTPVTGTFFQATQPVSIASMPSTPVTGTFWQATQPVSGTVTVTQGTLTKGTQNATGVSTQDLKDSGRVLKTYTVSALATVTSEALIQLTPYADLVASSGATTFAVSANKRLRIQKITVTVRCTSTVNVGGIVRLRLLAGTVLVSSPVHDSIGCMGSDLATAVIGNAQSFAMTFPDGLELSGTMQFGLTQLFSATTATIDVHVTGFEY